MCVGTAVDRSDAVVSESDGVQKASLSEAMEAELVIPETHREHDVAVAASPRRRILRNVSSSAIPGYPLTSVAPEEDSSLQEAVDFLAASLERGLSPEMGLAETQQEQEASVEVPIASVDCTTSGLVPGEEIWRRFTPSVIDTSRCLSRTYNGGAGGQCGRNPRAGEVTCGHCKKLVHGRVDGPIPEIKLGVFLRAAGKM